MINVPDHRAESDTEMMSTADIQDAGRDLRLTDDEVSRVVDLLREQLDDVKSGVVSGYGQSQEDEIADIGWLLDKLTPRR